jgi:ribulose-5-phosphate 4-epimerase/fuculose-1-phosphate aldolase
MTDAMQRSMFNPDQVQACRPAHCPPPEWQARVELAACYRVFAKRGWAEEIFNHISLRVPGPQPHFLINPFGLHYSEVTAHNLVKIDIDGNPVGETAHWVNRAGFVIHSAIHAARPDAHCVIHTHHSAGLAVACKEEGLSYDNFYAAFLYGRVAYHDFEGVAVNPDERPRLVASLGDKPCLILRNHGLLVAERDLAQAFYWMYVLHRACEIQVLAHSMAGATRPLTQAACEMSARNVVTSDPQGILFQKVLNAAVRSAGVGLEALVTAI